MAKTEKTDRIKIEVFQNEESLFHQDLDKDVDKIATIGRLKQNSVVLESQEVSKEHCRIYFEDGQWLLEDIRDEDKRKFQTLIKVNGKDVVKASLRIGDFIQIGVYEIKVAESDTVAEGTFSQTPDRRVKTPTVLQMEAVECGAAALAIVLGCYERFEPLEQLRIECGVSRDGSKAINILKAARKYGLAAKGFRYDNLQDLYELDFPLILWWNENHFLVLEGFRKNRVYLNDPAQGPRVISMDELNECFSGVVLTFEKGPDFKPGGTRTSILRALHKRLAGSESALFFVILCGLFLVVPGLIIPTFTRVFIDEYLIAHKAALIKPLLIGMGITAMLRILLTWLREYVLLRFETKLALVSSSKFFNHILHLPVAYFAQRFSGEIGSRVLINNDVAHVVSEKLATTMLDCFMIIFYAALMLMYDSVLTGACIALSLVNVAVVKYASRKRVDANRRVLQDDGKLTGTAMDGLKMIETLKATGSEDDFFARWAGYQAKYLTGTQDLMLIGKLVSAVPKLVKTLITTLILALGGLRIMDGHLTVGMLVAFQSLMASFTKPLENFVNFGGELQELEGDMNRLDDVLRYPVDSQYTQEAEFEDALKNEHKLSGRLELKNIIFGYSPLDNPLIENFNLTIEPGERVALVGGSGSGKSTVARLITGLYKPWEGAILFDGVPRDRVPPRLLNNSLGIVDQDIFLFAGTIRENLTMWDATMPDINLIAAARDAAIDDVIQARQSGYFAMVDEAGANFSGGQRQRIEIARALVGNPSILILDEATSALDPSTEKVIGDNLRRRGCSCIIVAHRLSTIRDCDEILVLDKGKIQERGTHDELLKKDGLYARLIEE
jgi:NHLM bacteriocin system ABC transporter peptidase/ATP-binding protein